MLPRSKDTIMKTLLKNLLGISPRGETTRRPENRSRLRVETLDDRCLMSVSAYWNGAFLTIADSNTGQIDNHVEVIDRVPSQSSTPISEMEIHVNGEPILIHTPGGDRWRVPSFSESTMSQMDVGLRA